MHRQQISLQYLLSFKNYHCLDMLPEYSHTKSESLAQISSPVAEIQNFFLGDCFFIGAPCSVYARRVTTATFQQVNIQSVSKLVTRLLNADG